MSSAQRPARPTVSEELLALLGRYVSAINAKALLRSAAQSQERNSEALNETDLPDMVTALRSRLPVFLTDPQRLKSCLSGLEELVAQRAQRSPAAPTARDVTIIEIEAEDDIVAARMQGREVCRELGFRSVDQVKIATAISELARNIILYAKRGRIELHRLRAPEPGLEIVARDNGPGIADVDAVLSGRHSSRFGMGMGLRGTRRLMDDFQIRSALGIGTTVRARKYKR
ncbi:MAG: anti-sigma regulatory factor [Polyangia bacterium]